MGRRNFSSVATLHRPHSPAATALLLRTIRHEKGWTTLAQMSRATGAHVNSLRAYEQGKISPSPASWHAILEAAGIDPAILDTLLTAAEEIAAAFSGDSLNPRLRSAADFLPDLEDLVCSVATFLARMPEPPEEPPDLEDQLRRILACDQSRRNDVIRITAEFQSHPLCVLCCKTSIRAVAADPKLARELAGIAVTVSDTVAFPSQGALRANALAHLGNAFRVAGDLDQAEALFDKAEPLWESAMEDPIIFDPGLIYQFKASLRRDQQRLADALQLSDRVVRITSSLGRALLNRATILEKLGRNAEALDTLDRADSLLAPREARDEWILCHGRGVNLAHLGRYHEASKFAEEAEGWVRQTGNTLDALRTDWLRARLLGATGNAAAARSLFDQVRQAFFERGLPREAALVSGECCSL